MVPRAPRAMALSTSCPERMPLSSQTSMRSPTASTIAGSALMVEGAPSSWRPPWLLTTSASAPESAANRASSASRMPLSTSLPPQRRLIHSTSPQFSRGSNWRAVHSDSEPMSSTPLTCPTMLPKPRRRVPSMPSAQRGLVAMFSRLARVGRGGAERPFFRSLWRWPMICRSRVSTSASQPAALARSIRRSMKSRSRIT